jgi:hypothetical protein
LPAQRGQWLRVDFANRLPRNDSYQIEPHGTAGTFGRRESAAFAYMSGATGVPA